VWINHKNDANGKNIQYTSARYNRIHRRGSSPFVGFDTFIRLLLSSIEINVVFCKRCLPVILRGDLQTRKVVVIHITVLSPWGALSSEPPRAAKLA